MKSHLILWFVTACIAVALSVLVPRMDSAAPMSSVLAKTCRHTPDAHGFAWADDGKLICITPKAKS